LGWTHFWDVYYKWSQSPKISVGKAFELAQKALAMEERIDLTHSLLGSIYYMSRKYEKALAEAERAVSLNPNGAAAYMILASIVSQLGRWDDGIAFGLKAIRLNPVPELGNFIILGRAHFMIGQYEEASSWCKKALNVNPNFLPARAFLTACYSSLGRQMEAAAEAEEIIRINPKFNLDSYVKTLHYKEKSDVDRYIDELRKAGLPEHPPLPLPDKPSIAVLAFDNLSGDPEQEYFSDGIAENIITALSKVGELFVIARNSSFTYKGKPVKVQQVSRELGVRYVLEGSVRRSSDKVRITAQLIDAKTGQHLWAEKYDREFKEIFEIQDEITMKIVTALRVNLTEGEQIRVYAKQFKSLDVYLKQVQANSLWNKGTKEALMRYGQLAQEVIDTEPESPGGYRLRAYYHKALADYWISPEENIKTAFKLAQKALSIDESDSYAHTALGFIYSKMREYEKAIASGKRSVELDPNNAFAICLYGSTLANAERFEEAIVYLKQAIRLNPFPAYYYYYHLGRSYFFTRKYEDALAEYKKMLQRAPNSFLSHISLAVTYAQLDRVEEARASAEKALEINPNFSVSMLRQIWPYTTQDGMKVTIDAMRKAGFPE
jgi:TolB-like protein/Tfp pilus assembly protein PilF